MSDNKVYTVKEVARILHSSPNYIYQMIEKGYLPAIKLRSVKILSSTLEKFLKENEGKDFSNIDEIKKLTIEEK